MTMQDKPKRRWGRWVVLSLLLIALVTAGGHWKWGVRAEKRLRARVDALRAQGEPMLPEDFRAPALADAANFVVDLRAAARLIDANDPAWQALDNLEHFKLPMTDKERAAMEAATAKYAESIRRVRQSRNKAGADWGLAFDGPMLMVLLPDLNPTRDLANLIAARALVAHQAGDDAEAVEALRDLLAVSRAVDQMPFLVSHLVSLGVSALAVDRAEQIAPGLHVSDGKAATRRQALALIGDLLDEAPLSEGHRRAYRGERAAQLDTMRRLHSGELSINAVAAGSGGGATQTLQSTLGYGLKPIILGDAELMVAYMTHVIAALDKSSWPQHKAAAPDITRQVAASKVRHMFARMLLPALDRAAERHYRMLAERRMAAVALALRLYALEHDGKLPEKLQELVPKYLSAIPSDPMAATVQPFGYKPHGGRPMLYSVGGNGQDDAGSDQPLRPRPGSGVTYGRWEREDAIFDLQLQERPKVDQDEEPDVEEPARTPGGFP